MTDTPTTPPADPPDDWQRARQALAALCMGVARRSIPARPDDDDLVIDAMLTRGQAAEAGLEALWAVAARATALSLAHAALDITLEDDTLPAGTGGIEDDARDTMGGVLWRLIRSIKASSRRAGSVASRLTYCCVLRWSRVLSMTFVARFVVVSPRDLSRSLLILRWRSPMGLSGMVGHDLRPGFPGGRPGGAGSRRAGADGVGTGGNEVRQPAGEGVVMDIISLGAGVQSTTMLLMALHGEIAPRPDAAVFADTGWEPAAVYRHLDWLEGVMRDAGVPLYRVSGGDLRADAIKYGAGELRGGWRLPLFVRDRDGAPGMLGRQCTRNYKIRPIHRQIKSLLKPTGATHATSWVGISLDEATRMKPSGVSFITNRWPLVEQRMTRHDCLLWLERHGYPRPPKSACIGCPLHGDDEWRAIKADPLAWTDAIEADAAIRNLPGRNAISAYLHRSLVPLPMVDLTTPQERGQMSLWDQECEGMCGV